MSEPYKQYSRWQRDRDNYLSERTDRFDSLLGKASRPRRPEPEKDPLTEECDKVVREEYERLMRENEELKKRLADLEKKA